MERQKRVMTYRMSDNYKYSKWTDRSADIHSINYMNRLPLVRFEIIKQYGFTP